jgi:hypothetical protein
MRLYLAAVSGGCIWLFVGPYVKRANTKAPPIRIGGAHRNALEAYRLKTLLHG